MGNSEPPSWITWLAAIVTIGLGAVAVAGWLIDRIGSLDLHIAAGMFGDTLPQIALSCVAVVAGVWWLTMLPGAISEASEMRDVRPPIAWLLAAAVGALPAVLPLYDGSVPGEPKPHIELYATGGFVLVGVFLYWLVGRELFAIVDHVFASEDDSNESDPDDEREENSHSSPGSVLDHDIAPPPPSVPPPDRDGKKEEPEPEQRQTTPHSTPGSTPEHSVPPPAGVAQPEHESGTDAGLRG